MTYTFLQHYWCFVVSLLGAILVFLLFVQGANSVARSLGYTEEGRRLVYNSTGRKWEFTFTTLVTFGGAFFASFPCSTPPRSEVPTGSGCSSSSPLCFRP